MKFWADVRLTGAYTWAIGPGFEPSLGSNFNGTGKPEVTFFQGGANPQLMDGPGLQGSRAAPSSA